MKEKTKRKLIIAIWCVVFIPVGALLLFVTGVGLFAEIPSFEELENPKTYLATELISEDGKLIGTYHIENRTHVGYNELSPYIVSAAIATEDVRFYNHCGIDFRSLARVGRPSSWAMPAPAAEAAPSPSSWPRPSSPGRRPPANSLAKQRSNWWSASSRNG